MDCREAEACTRLGSRGAAFGDGNSVRLGKHADMFESPEFCEQASQKRKPLHLQARRTPKNDSQCNLPQNPNWRAALVLSWISRMLQSRVASSCVARQPPALLCTRPRCQRLAVRAQQEVDAAPVEEASTSGRQLEKVPISELPKPHPKANKTLTKSMNKVRNLRLKQMGRGALFGAMQVVQGLRITCASMLCCFSFWTWQEQLLLAVAPAMHWCKCLLNCLCLALLPSWQTGLYKALVDALESVSFTVIGDDSELNWAVAQVRDECACLTYGTCPQKAKHMAMAHNMDINYNRDLYPLHRAWPSG